MGKTTNSEKAWEERLSQLEYVEAPESLVQQALGEVRRGSARMRPAPAAARKSAVQVRRRGWFWSLGGGVAAGVAAALVAVMAQPLGDGDRTTTDSRVLALHGLELAGVDVVAVEGAVFLQRSGDRSPITTGAVLQHGDVLHTHEQGAVTLQFGQGIGVWVDGDSQIALFLEGYEIPRVEVRQGRIEGWVAGDGASLALSGASGGQRVDEHPLLLWAGKLGAVKAASTQLVAAALDGPASVDVYGKSMLLPQHHVVSIPTYPEADLQNVVSVHPVPSKLSVEIEQESVLKSKQQVLQLVGKTAPNTLLVLQGQSVVVRPDGSFSVGLRVSPESRTVAGYAKDVLGRKQAIALDIKRVKTSTSWEQAAPEEG